jgi:peptidoglycan hydrolase-like protein with peptidoglycan-binding domain
MSWLTRGMRGDFVEGVQGLLHAAGLYDGRIDGSYGSKTEAAVKDWQRAIGATPDGAWGPQTIGHSASFLATVNDGQAVKDGLAPVVPTMQKRGM